MSEMLGVPSPGSLRMRSNVDCRYPASAAVTCSLRPQEPLLSACPPPSTRLGPADMRTHEAHPPPRDQPRPRRHPMQAGGGELGTGVWRGPLLSATLTSCPPAPGKPLTGGGRGCPFRPHLSCTGQDASSHIGIPGSLEHSCGGPWAPRQAEHRAKNHRPPPISTGRRAAHLLPPGELPSSQSSSPLEHSCPPQQWGSPK